MMLYLMVPGVHSAGQLVDQHVGTALGAAVGTPFDLVVDNYDDGSVRAAHAFILDIERSTILHGLQVFVQGYGGGRGNVTRTMLAVNGIIHVIEGAPMPAKHVGFCRLPATIL